MTKIPYPAIPVNVPWEALDPGISSVVKLLVNKGYRPLFSCEGGWGHDPLGPYVAVEGRPAELKDVLASAGYPVRTILPQQEARGDPPRLVWRTVAFLYPLS